MKLNTSLIITVLACLCLSLSAQKPVITGTVLEKGTYLSITNANIRIPGTNYGCVTDKYGDFTMVADTLPVYIIISHIGYETQRIWLDHASVGMNILLEPSVEMLKPVEINGKHEAVPFFKDDVYSVLDYETQNTLVYLLIYRYHLARSQLICMSDKGDTIAVSGNLPFKPVGLFTDCLGYLHILSADSSYQVFLNKDTIIFPYKNEIYRFLKTMSDCVASSHNWLYFRKESDDHLNIEFYMINRKTKMRKYFASASDEAMINQLRKNPYDYYLVHMDTLPNTNLQMVEWVLVNKLIYHPNESVLKKTGDSIAIFNTSEGSLSYFSRDGTFLSTFSIPVNEKKGERWTREIYADDLTHQFYTSFEKNGKTKVYLIDIVTGRLIYETTLSHAFPQKLRIDNDNLFYLYNQPGINDNKKLFRQKI